MQEGVLGSLLKLPTPFLCIRACCVETLGTARSFDKPPAILALAHISTGTHKNSHFMSDQSLQLSIHLATCAPSSPFPLLCRFHVLFDSPVLGDCLGPQCLKIQGPRVSTTDLCVRAAQSAFLAWHTLQSNAVATPKTQNPVLFGNLGDMWRNRG